MIFSWQDFKTHILQSKRQLIAANILALAGALISIPIPLLLPFLVDELVLNQPGLIIPAINTLLPYSQSTVFYLTVVTLFSILLRFAVLAFNVLQTRQFTLISKHIVFIIRQRLLQKLQNISIKAYEGLGSGKVANHFTVDIQTIDSFINDALRKFILGTITAVSVLCVLAFINIYLVLFLIILNPLVVLFTRQLGKKVKLLKQRENSAFEVFQTSLVETLDAIHQIRISNRSQYFFNALNQQSAEIKAQAASYTWKSEVANRASSFIFMIGFDLFRAGGLLLVLFSGLTVGQMFAAFAYLWILMGSMQEIFGIQYSYAAAKAALERVNALAELENQPEPIGRRNPFKNNKATAISISNLSFQYRQDAQILQDINFTIKAGEKIALVGSSGSGKSTLIQLLLGIYRVDSGSICYNQTPIEQINSADLHTHVASVLQNPALLNDTIRHNMTLGSNIDDTRLYDALKRAQLYTLVKRQPDGLDTHIGMRGMRLSGGQKQRLAIARILLAEPQVVILDEATSALDIATEKLVFAGLQDFFMNKTVIIAAHRESALALTERRLNLSTNNPNINNLNKNNGSYIPNEPTNYKR